MMGILNLAMEFNIRTRDFNEGGEEEEGIGIDKEGSESDTADKANIPFSEQELNAVAEELAQLQHVGHGLVEDAPDVLVIRVLNDLIRCGQVRLVAPAVVARICRKQCSINQPGARGVKARACRTVEGAAFVDGALESA